MTENTGGIKCDRCDGCGQLADSDDREPWSYWLELPWQSAIAVTMGWVKPIPCDKCGGTGIAEPDHLKPSQAVGDCGCLPEHTNGLARNEPAEVVDLIETIRDRSRCRCCVSA